MADSGPLRIDVLTELLLEASKKLVTEAIGEADILTSDMILGWVDRIELGEFKSLVQDMKKEARTRRWAETLPWWENRHE